VQHAVGRWVFDSIRPDLAAPDLVLDLDEETAALLTPIGKNAAQQRGGARGSG